MVCSWGPIDQAVRTAARTYLWEVQHRVKLLLLGIIAIAALVLLLRATNAGVPPQQFRVLKVGKL